MEETIIIQPYTPVLLELQILVVAEVVLILLERLEVQES